MLQDFQQKAQGVVEHFKDELRKVRTGRAQPSMVDSVLVEVASYGGARMKINELSTITAPDPSLLVIQPFDPSVIQDIERAINIANLGFSPTVDQHIIRISVPPLTAERREQMQKIVAQRLEDAKISLRNVRSEIKESIEAQEGVSEDDIDRQLKELQTQVDAVTQQLDQLRGEKDQELVQI